MNTIRKQAVLVGVFFIIAAVAAILGLAAYDPIINNPDYLTTGPTASNQIVLGAIFEMFTAVAVAGTAIAFFPILRKHNETIALGYVGGRLLEAVLIIIGLVSMLTLMSLRQAVEAGAILDAAALPTVSKLLRSTHAWSFILGPSFMLGINTLLYSTVLYRTKLVPRRLASLGLIAAAAIFTAALLELFGIILQVSAWGAILALPVAVYEISLAVYLIVKGFNPSAITPASTNMATGALQTAHQV
jgi:hypothetical protein